MQLFQLIFIVILPILTYSQEPVSYCVSYNVTQQIKNPDFPDKTLGNYNLEGNLFKRGEEIIYLEKAAANDSLQQSITYDGANGVSKDFLLATANIRTIYYFNLDSSILKFSINYFSDIIRNTKFKFERGYQQWEILPESKKIADLLVQKAIQKNARGQVTIEIWFAPEIPVHFGPSGMMDSPGLVVEAIYHSISTSYVLTGYHTECTIEEDIFKPENFNQPFIDRGTIRKPKQQ